MGILLQVLLLAVGFVMLVKGADWFVDGSSGIATKFKIKWLTDYALPLSLVCGMISAIPFNSLLGG